MKYEYKNEGDKYKQVVKAICKCGMSSNYHLDTHKAKIGLQQNHEDNRGCYIDKRLISKEDFR